MECAGLERFDEENNDGEFRYRKGENAGDEGYYCEEEDIAVLFPREGLYMLLASQSDCGRDEGKI